MEELRSSDSAGRDDKYYREQWTFYYAERRRLLTRVIWMAGGLGIGLLLLFATHVDKYPRIAQVLLALPIGLLLIVLPLQWFIFVWEFRTWPCPRCADRFFTSTFVNNPFGRRCRHCGLLRLKHSKIKNLSRENQEP
jgi:hypothetical protein